jgi:long-chain acyl-CoA synthetase
MPLLRQYAQANPDKLAALVIEAGETITFGALDRRSAFVAQHFVKEGLATGDAIAILIGNSLRYFEVAWGARRAGLYFVPISTHLTNAETQYIIEDSGARLLFVASDLLGKVSDMPASLRERVRIIEVGGTEYLSMIEGTGAVPALPDRPMGLDFAYSSGTTGRPKGIKQKMTGDPHLAKALAGNWLAFFDLNPESVYLSPAPLYHAAPLRFSMRAIASGGTAVIMDRFDAQGALAAIQRYRVTHSQWVPTMFSRMLALPDDVRRRYDLSSMRKALHAAAPCPRDVKLKMLEWWGPIVWEYYSGSERNGATVISPAEWLQHQGSVGKAASGELRIVGEDGRLCEPGEPGAVYFANGPRFEYHNDPDKTAAAHNEQGWSTIGDIGYVDAQGYLYLTDRRANMIISGGVNIYPQEAENILLTHHEVVDAAVFGIPDADFGEQVMAVVQLKPGVKPSDKLAEGLMAYCRERLSHIKCPRNVDFASELPRTDTGKLMKRVVRDSYRQALAGVTSERARYWRLSSAEPK